MKINKNVVVLILALAVLFISRFLYLEKSARFTRDESSDLARMHAYWQEKKITLVGPISNDNIKVFSSLTYYMQMPFAAAYNFRPVGPVVGTAFWGVITILLVVFASDYQKNKLQFSVGSVAFLFLVVLWTPLLVTSRWAWNPHLVPFWIALALFTRTLSWRWKYLLVGLSFGMALHNHYIAIFSVLTFSIIEAVLLLKKKLWLNTLSLFGGLFLAVMPFLLFDLRHPPGLFLSSYLKSDAPNIVESQDLALFDNLLRNGAFALEEVAGPIFIQIPWLLLFCCLVFFDLKNSKNHFLFLLPVLAQVIGPVVVDGYHQRYFLPATVFLLLWMALQRKNNARKVAFLLILTTVIGSVYRLPAAFSVPEQVAPMSVVTEVRNQIVSIVHKNHVKNPNIAVITGEDLDSLAEKYRDLLSIDGISFRAASEYDASENLFVISTADEDSVRNDQNVSMQLFGDTRLIEVRDLNDGSWKLYWFGI